jgi:hypothetical protein
MADKIRIQNVLAEVQKRINEQRAQQLVELKKMYEDSGIDNRSINNAAAERAADRAKKEKKAVYDANRNSAKKTAKDAIDKAMSSQNTGNTKAPVMAGATETPKTTQVQFGKGNSQTIGTPTSTQSAANVNAPIANQNTPSKPKLVSSTPSSTKTTPSPSSSGSSSTSSPAASSSSSTAGSKYTPGSVSDKIHNMSTAVADSKLATGAGKVLSKAAVPLTVIGAGLEYGDRRSKGQSVGKAAGGAAADTAGGLAGAYGGATAGAALGALGGPLAPITVPLGGIAGGIAGAVGGSHLAGKAYDWATGADKDKPEGTSKSPEAPKEQEKPKLAAPALNGPFKDTDKPTPTPTPRPKDIDKPTPTPTPRPKEQEAPAPKADYGYARPGSDEDTASNFFRADAARMKAQGGKAANDFSSESGPKKKKVNEALLEAFYRFSNKINR